MKRKGHKHKESFSILLISNAGNEGRKFHISQLTLRLLICMFVLICVVALSMSFIVFGFYPVGAGHRNLSKQLETQEQLVAQLEAEKENLNNEILALQEENETLKQASENNDDETDKEPESDSDSTIPRRYPSSGVSAVLASYSEEQPYLSINTHTEGNIVATGNGTVTTVTSDETYPIIIEVEHDKGYKSRYMCHQDAEVQATEGAQVEAGDTLFTITIDDTQLDYQITFEENPIDPLTVIEAKG
ncbi:MAG: peptidoglycan DD-metalloendopeptidase family protein [Lachnospiraceae bacterium]|nr:peptidoglycan DD-metalloendopeptidase family protein [Lachnospiraceae bacterium]